MATTAGTAGIQSETASRQIVNKCLRDKLELSKQKKSIDNQRRTLEAHLSKEENDLRAQLQRLEVEKRGTVSETVPITKAKKSRCQSGNLEDSSINSRATNSFTTIQSFTRLAGQQSSAANIKQQQASNSCGRIADSSNPSAASQMSVATSEEDIWIGDPEAISSVRRSRKSVSQQRLSRTSITSSTSSRSGSFKDGSDASSPKPRQSVISRSKSMREKCNSFSCGSSGSIDPSEKWHLSNLIKAISIGEPREYMKSSEAMNDDASTVRAATSRLEMSRSSLYRSRHPGNNGEELKDVEQGQKGRDEDEMMFIEDSKSAVIFVSRENSPPTSPLLKQPEAAHSQWLIAAEDTTSQRPARNKSPHLRKGSLRRRTAAGGNEEPIEEESIKEQSRDSIDS